MSVWIPVALWSAVSFVLASRFGRLMQRLDERVD